MDDALFVKVPARVADLLDDVPNRKIWQTSLLVTFLLFAWVFLR